MGMVSAVRVPMKTPIISYLDESGKLSRRCKHKITDRQLVEIYQVMVLARMVDERMITLQRQGLITFALTQLGEEGCIVGPAAALKPEDWIYSQYREAAVVFWRGFPIQDYVHQMFGNSKDAILGRQMPNHYGSKKLNVVHVSSPLGTQIPHAAGAAYAMQLRGEKRVALCFLGEGTTSKGDFHTALNFAAVKKAPCIFLVRNNQYAISTKTCDQFATDGIAIKGVAHGVDSMSVDGNDIFAIHETVAKARKKCVAGKGPVLIEAVTYRRGAHSTSDDPTQYRPDKEVKAWEKKDPILRLKKYLNEKKLWNPSEERALKKEVKEQIDQAIEQAKETERPPIDSLIEDVYAEVPASLQEQLDEVKRCQP